MPKIQTVRFGELDYREEDVVHLPEGLVGMPDLVENVDVLASLQGTEGLLVDLLTGTLLGQHAMALAVIAWLTLRLHQRIRLFPVWQQALIVLVLLVLHQLLALWVDRFIGRPVPPWYYWTPSMVGMLLWPPIFSALRGLRRSFRVN